MDVPGVGPKKIGQIESLIEVKGNSKIEVPR